MSRFSPSQEWEQTFPLFLDDAELRQEVAIHRPWGSLTDFFTWMSDHPGLGPLSAAELARHFSSRGLVATDPQVAEMLIGLHPLLRAGCYLSRHWWFGYLDAEPGTNRQRFADAIVTVADPDVLETALTLLSDADPTSISGPDAVSRGNDLFIRLCTLATLVKV